MIKNFIAAMQTDFDESININFIPQDMSPHGSETKPEMSNICGYDLTL